MNGRRRTVLPVAAVAVLLAGGVSAPAASKDVSPSSLSSETQTAPWRRVRQGLKQYVRMDDAFRSPICSGRCLDRDGRRGQWRSRRGHGPGGAMVSIRNWKKEEVVCSKIWGTTFGQ